MKQIFLLRHAKSDWSTMGQQDFDRGLASRGIKDISLISDYVKKNNFKLDEVLCSSANRTKETFDLCADGFDFDIKNVKYLDDLYYGNHESIIDLLVNINQAANSVLIVGHNPAIQETVLRLSDTDQNSNLLNRVEHKYPTAAFCTLTSTIDKWSHTGDTMFKIKEFICPKEL